MQIIDHIQFGPFSTQYHSALVNDDFKSSLSGFLRSELFSQLDEPVSDADGTLTATFNNDRFCGPNSLVRNIFTLKISLYGDDGKSDLKSDIEYNPDTSAFSQRTGHGHNFYLWTPRRRQNRENEMEMIQRLVDEYRRTHKTGLVCPICQGNVTGVDDPSIFDLRCVNNRCFVYNYHKDEDGRLAHGHFFTYHPAIRG